MRERNLHVEERVVSFLSEQVAARGKFLHPADGGVILNCTV